MRVTVEGRLREELPTEFEPPPGGKDRNQVTLRVQRHPTSTAIALRLHGTAGPMVAIWDSTTGKLLWAPGEQVSDIGWSPDGTEVFVLVNRGEYAGPQRVGHRLQRYDWPGRTLLQEMQFSVPSGGADRLVISPSGRRGLVIAIEQGAWNYEVLDLRTPLCQLDQGHHIPEWLGDCPAFSPDERYLVAVGSPGTLWWAPPTGDWEAAAEAGPHRLGTVYVHNLQRGSVKEHPLIVELPKGWRPEDPAGGRWAIVWGPSFQGARAFRVWLPDGRPLTLNLPLPKTIAVRGRLRKKLPDALF